MKVFRFTDGCQSASDPRLDQSAPNAQALEPALGSTPPRVEVPPALHGSIMQAVRSAHSPEHSKRHADDGLRARLGRNFWWWLTVPSAAVLIAVAVGVIGYIRGQENSSDPGSVVTPFHTGDKITDAVPALALAPLTDELELLDHDLESAQKLLAASLP